MPSTQVRRRLLIAVLHVPTRNTLLLQADIYEPCAGFVDPFDAVKTITLDNPKYRVFGVPLMQGKLDWVLLRRLAVHATAVGNHDYVASDHKWLSVEVSFHDTQHCPT